MLFDSSLRKDLARTFGATLVVVLTIVLTITLVRTLGQAASGRISPQDVVLFLGYFALAYLPIMLSLSLFTAVVMSLGRMYRESEMAIWFASGVGLSRFVRPVLHSSWPVLLVISLLLFFGAPWANQQINDMRERFEQRSDLSRVAPGQFQTSRDGRRVFFIDRSSEDGLKGRNVFILSNQGENESVTTASSGYIDNSGDVSFLMLNQGQRNEQNQRTHEKTVSQFDSYKVQVGTRKLSTPNSVPPRARGTFDLLQTPEPAARGELAWRVGLALGACNMALLGIGLSATQPRRASYWNPVYVLLSFTVYFNLINLSKAWIESGKLEMGAALMVTHASAFVLALGILWWRDGGVHLSFKRKAAAA